MKKVVLIGFTLLGVVSAVLALTLLLSRILATAPVSAKSQLDAALTTMLTSHTRWQTVSGSAEFLWYGDAGDTQSFTDQFALELPSKIYVNVIDHTGLSGDAMSISDGQNWYAVDKKNKTYSQSPFPQEKLDLSDLPTSLSQISLDDVISHPVARMVGLPVMEYLFPVSFPQGPKGAVYTLKEETTFLERKVWVIELHIINRDDVTAWVDQQTGIILKYNQNMDGRKFLEMAFTSFRVNASIPLNTFTPPAGYTSTSPTIPALEVSTPPAAKPTAAATESGAQKKQVLLIKNEQGYYLSDFSGAKGIALKLPVEIEIISMSPDGRMIAYLPTAHGNELYSIHIFDIASGRDKKLSIADDMMIGPMGMSWSPDGREIAFTCVKIGSQNGLSLCSVDATEAELSKVLVKSGGLDAKEYTDGANSPSWSADGKTIAFQSARSPAVPSNGGKLQKPIDFWLFDVVSQQAHRVFVGGTAGISLLAQPFFLPGENALLFSGRKETYDTLFKYNLDTQEIQDITATGKRYNIWNTLLSPDGKTFVANIMLAADGTDFVPALFSLDGTIIKQFDALKNIQIVSWGEQ